LVVVVGRGLVLIVCWRRLIWVHSGLRGAIVSSGLLLLSGVWGLSIGSHHAGRWRHASHHSSLEFDGNELAILENVEPVVPAGEEGRKHQQGDAEDDDLAQAALGLLQNLRLLLGAECTVHAAIFLVVIVPLSGLIAHLPGEALEGSRGVVLLPQVGVR